MMEMKICMSLSSFGTVCGNLGVGDVGSPTVRLRINFWWCIYIALPRYSNYNSNWNDASASLLVLGDT